MGQAFQGEPWEEKAGERQEEVRAFLKPSIIIVIVIVIVIIVVIMIIICTIQFWDQVDGGKH